MSTLLLERLPVVARDFGGNLCDPHHLHDPRDRQADSARTPERDGAYDRLTLDDLVTRVWEGLAVRATVSCPVCAGPMAFGSRDTGAEAPMGACLSCGSQLS
jgi:hypothetical protein